MFLTVLWAIKCHYPNEDSKKEANKTLRLPTFMLLMGLLFWIISRTFSIL